MAFLLSGERVMLVTDSWDDNRVSAAPQLNVMVSRGWIIAPAQHFTLQNIQAYIYIYIISGLLRLVLLSHSTPSTAVQPLLCKIFVFNCPILKIRMLKNQYFRTCSVLVSWFAGVQLVTSQAARCLPRHVGPAEGSQGRETRAHFWHWYTMYPTEMSPY